MHWHWHCIEFCIVIVLAFFVGRGPYSWSRVATLGRGQLAPQLGVFFRQASQLRGRILGAFGLWIVMLLAVEIGLWRVSLRWMRKFFRGKAASPCAGPGVSVFQTYACLAPDQASRQWWR